jgi:hypothetical protein
MTSKLKSYRVFFRFTQYHRGSISVEASDLREAIEKAREESADTAMEDHDDYEMNDSETYIIAADEYDGAEKVFAHDFAEISADPGDPINIEEEGEEFEEIDDDLPEPGDIRETGK